MKHLPFDFGRTTIQMYTFTLIFNIPTKHLECLGYFRFTEYQDEILQRRAKLKPPLSYLHSLMKSTTSGAICPVSQHFAYLLCSTFVSTRHY